jgi:anti-sigma-K factor RskA
MSKHGSTSGNGPMNPELDTLSGAYALNALTEDERQAFEARLGESPELRQEVAELNETALLLGHAATPVTPSAGLRSSILDLLDSTPQLPRLEERAQDPAPAASSPGVTGGAEILEPIPLARQRWFMRPGVLLIGAAAAVGLFFGGVGVAGQLNPSPSATQGPIASGDVAQILTASDVRHTASDIRSGGKATLYWSNDLKRSAVVLDGLTSLPADKTYQLWYIKGTDIKSAGTVSPTSNTVTQVLQGDMQQGDTVGITVEPTGGSKQPTTTPVAALQSA